MNIKVPKRMTRFYLKGQIDTFVYRSYVDAKTREEAIKHYLTKHYMTNQTQNRDWIDKHLSEVYS